SQLRVPRDIHPYQQRLRSGECVFQIPDLAATETYRSGNPLTKLAVEAGTVRTVAFVALVKDGATLGGFTIGHSPGRISLWLKLSRPSRSTRGKMRGCSVNCANEQATWRNRSNTRPQRATYCR